MTNFDYDLFVIGAGSGGVRAARIAAKYGFKEAWLVGKYPAPGFQQFVWSGLIF